MSNDVEDFLEHFGVKGMRWGVRKDAAPGVPSKTDRAAKSDATEFARAKMFYGQGAGTRRKLISESVKAKSSKDPLYAKAFDHHLSNQDMSTHATKAVGERKSIDRKTKTKQSAGHIARRLTGEMGTTAAFTAAAIAGATYLNSPSGKRLRIKAMTEAKIWMNSSRNNATVSYVTDFLNRN